MILVDGNKVAIASNKRRTLKVKLEEVVEELLAMQQRMNQDISDGAYEASRNYTGKDILVSTESLLAKIIRDLAAL